MLTDLPTLESLTEIPDGPWRDIVRAVVERRTGEDDSVTAFQSAIG
ncbi:hypothetical protein GCM10023170_010140 [Phytohabitans houttuyneae]|uniref:Uncharacterized protein n=1 Tax=Phytohabitans houttuyneae TaxID=1076126 RepID=A0A6V8K2N2_9ACTN|nr:hypothetical protein Phou_035820 [Phytohabitans houttuyneae]